MGLFQSIRNFFTSSAQGQSLAKKMGVIYQVAEDIPSLIAEWRDLYMSLDNGTDTKPSGLAPMIAKDLATKACAELTITAGDDSDLGIFNRDMLLNIRQQTEYALAMGYVVMRPYVSGGAVKYSWYSADRVIPTGWEGRNLTACMLLDYKTKADTGITVIYTKAESHGFDIEDGKYHIKTKLFKNFGSSGGEFTGTEVPLSSIEEWAEITPDVIIENPSTKTFVYMGTPIANNKALNIPIGCSIFKDAIPWLREFDEALKSASWENWSGRAKLFLADSMMPKKSLEAGGKRLLVDDATAIEKKYFKKLETESTENLIEPYNPQLRFESYESYMNYLLHMICTLSGLDAGQYVFDESSRAVTAKEIVSKQQKTYNTIVDIQTYMITPIVEQIVNSVRQLQMLYGLPEIPLDVDLSIDFGDSILTDEETEKQTAQLEVQQGLRSKLSYMMEYRGLTEEEAVAELERIKADAPVLFSEGF